MKKFIFALLMILALGAVSARAQQFQFTAPDCEFGFTYSVVSGVITSTTSLSAQRLPLSMGGGGVVGFDNRFKGCISWSIVYVTEGVSGISIEMDQAPSSAGVPGTWTIWPSGQVAPGSVLPLTGLNFGGASVFSFRPWISVNLNSATGTGAVSGRVAGWRPQPGQDIVQSGNATLQATGTPQNSTATAAANAPVPITIAGAVTQSVRISRIDASCSAGTATLTIADGATTIANFSVAAASFGLNYSQNGLVLTAGNTVTITLGACGVGNTGRLNVAAVQY